MAQIRSGLVKPQQRAAAVQDHGPIGGKAEPEHAGIGEIRHLSGEIRQGNQGVRYPFSGDGGQIVVGYSIAAGRDPDRIFPTRSRFLPGIDRHLVKRLLRPQRRAEELHGPSGAVHQEQLPAGNQIFIDSISVPQQLPAIGRQLGQAVQRREAVADRSDRIGDFSCSGNLRTEWVTSSQTGSAPTPALLCSDCLRQRGLGPVLAAGQKRQKENEAHDPPERKFGTHDGPPWLGELEPSKSIYSDPTA